MKKNKLNILLDAIVSTSKTFLENDMQIKVNKISEAKESSGNNYSARVSFSGDLNCCYLITIDKLLLENILRVMVPFTPTSKEKKEIMNSLSDEVINTVAGLAISEFPALYKDLVMSTPVLKDTKNLKIEQTKSLTLSKKIETEFGHFICCVYMSK